MQCYSVYVCKYLVGKAGRECGTVWVVRDQMIVILFVSSVQSAPAGCPIGRLQNGLQRCCTLIGQFSECPWLWLIQSPPNHMMCNPIVPSQIPSIHFPNGRKWQNPSESLLLTTHRPQEHIIMLRGNTTGRQDARFNRQNIGARFGANRATTGKDSGQAVVNKVNRQR